MHKLKLLILIILCSAVQLSFAQNVWQTCSNGLPVEFGIVDFELVGGEIFASGSYSNDTARIYTSSDTGQTWIQLPTASLDSYQAAAAIINHNGTLLLSVNNGQTDNSVMVSADNGQTWTASNTGLPATFSVLSFVLDGSTILAAGSNFATNPFQAELYKSTNNGANWTQVSANLTGFLSCNGLLNHNNQLYLAATTGFTNSVLVSTDNGTSWTPTAGSPASNFLINDTETLGDSILAPGSLVSFSGLNSAFYQSPDFGNTWGTLSVSGLSAYSSATAIFNHGGKLFLAASSSVDDNTLFCSFINKSPAVINPINDQVFTEGFVSQDIDISNTFNDPDGDALIYTASSSNENVATVGVSGTTLTITEVAVGTSTITLTADDNRTGTVNDVFTVTINEPPNSDPTVINPLADQSYDEGFASTTIDITNTFNDADGDNLTVSALSSNENVLTVSITGNTLTITEIATGTATVTLTADDGNGGSVADAFLVSINELGNTNPTVSNPIADQTYDEGFGSDKIDISNTFTDSDGHNLSKSAISNNETIITVSITNDSLMITEVSPGNTTVVVMADDGNGGVVNDTFAVTITPTPNALPTVANPIADKTYTEGFNSDIIDLTDTFNDLDGDNLSLSATSGNTGVLTLSFSGDSLTIHEVGLGNTDVVVTADDGKGGSVSDTFSVTINEVVGIQQNDFKYLELYPNPTNENIYLQLGKPISGQARVMTLSGSLILEKQIQHQSLIPIALKLPSGIYLLILESNDGKTARMKVMKN